MALEVKVYKLGGIVAPDSTLEQVVPIAKAIVRTVHPDSWESMGGAGKISAVKLDSNVDKNWRLVVLSEFQTQIADLLNQIKN